jgi:hypothetical protein
MLRKIDFAGSGGRSSALDECVGDYASTEGANEVTDDIGVYRD